MGHSSKYCSRFRFAYSFYDEVFEITVVLLFAMQKRKGRYTVNGEKVRIYVRMYVREYKKKEEKKTNRNYDSVVGTGSRQRCHNFAKNYFR